MEHLNYQAALFSTEQQSITSDDYYTPQWIFDALGLQFDLDVACPPGGPLFTPCLRYFTQEDDGLAQPWEGLVWCNPPYSKPGPWVDRFVDHGNGVALLPFTRGAWNLKIWNSDFTVAFVPQMKFHRPGMAALQDSGAFANVIWAAGDQVKQALEAAQIGKIR